MSAYKESHEKRILYLRPGKGRVSLNERTATLLQQEFPEYEVSVADVRSLVKGAPFTAVTNLLVAAWVYRKDILRKKKNLRQCFWRTSFIFRRIRGLVHRAFGETAWTFTFQIQSLFDCSIEGVPHFVYTDHTHLANLNYPGFDPSQLFATSWIRCEREIYLRAARVFTMSTNMRSSLIHDYNIEPGKVTCVFSGPNIPIDSDSVEHDEALPLEILFVGMDWHRKGGDLLLAAHSKVKQDFPQTRIVIVGCEAPDPAARIDGVEFIGRVPLDEVGRYFHRASIFCMPTRLEPFGIVFIEAMAYGLPIVATRIGAIPDLVSDGENGLLIESEDIEGLACALRRLLSDSEERQRMGRNGQQRYLDHFNWPAVYAEMRDRICSHVRLSNKPRLG